MSLARNVEGTHTGLHLLVARPTDIPPTLPCPIRANAMAGLALVVLFMIIECTLAKPPEEI